MPNTKIQAAEGRRRILIVDDEAINRAMLGAMLESEYETLFAETGAAALEALRDSRGELSIVLLDLLLPDMHGLDILRRIKGDPELAHVPVIVMTSDREAEVECLNLGASDFIPKPYPMPRVVLARVNRTVELSEDRELIRSTERDALTGLYNRDYFYRYARQLDRRRPDLAMDAIVVDVNHFHLINERRGKAYGDAVLRGVAEGLRACVAGDGGIVCRREGDTFLVYCPHRADYSAMLDRASERLESRVRLRMGVYSDVDKAIDIERRFDHAKLAADTVRNSFSRAIALYDSALHESELFSEQLLEDFDEAIAQRQFVVYYQPKFDIRAAEPVLSSAEALVRWKHPRLGMVSPGVFVPLFESNGLIQRLDSYVWRAVAAQQMEWKQRLGVCVPISVNVSRVDMFDDELVEHMNGLMREFSLSPEEFLLEITESAYTQDSDQIVDMVNRLRQAGFSIEMDDFGSGYSSLNMISTLPVDALKLDMQFIRNAFKGRKNTKMLEVVIDIADSLSVPTIAEGVETAEQMLALKSMGCDIVQGYYFSKPVPAEEFEPFLLARKQVLEAPRPFDSKPRQETPSDQFIYDALHDPVTGLYNHSGYEILLRDADQGHIGLLIANVDRLEAIRRERGREVADRVVERVAEALRTCFRSVDFVCRISADEFAVIITRVDSGMSQLVLDKMAQVEAMLARPGDDLPGVTLTAGLAFGDRPNPQGDIFQDADAALYRMKAANRSGCGIF